MVVWSPSSWSLWKSCPAKYRIKKVERWRRPDLREDTEFVKLTIPGIVVDKMLQLWLHRNQFSNKTWLDDNFDMVWAMVNSEVKPTWSSAEEVRRIKDESIKGLFTAVRLLDELHLEKFELYIQPSFFEKMTEEFSITGAADLLLIEKGTTNGLLLDFKNAHRRQNVTKDQLILYKLGLTRTMPLNITKAGYLMFNPRLEQWKWFKMHKVFEDQLLEKLSLATQAVNQRQFDYRWNYFTCARFCDVRFSCEMFQQLMGKRVPFNPPATSKRFVLKDHI